MVRVRRSIITQKDLANLVISTAIVPYHILFIESALTTVQSSHTWAANSHLIIIELDINYRLVTFCSKISFFYRVKQISYCWIRFPSSRRPGMAWYKCSLITFIDTPHEVMVVSLRFSCALNPFAFINSVAISDMLGKRSMMDFLLPSPLLFFSVGCFASGIALSSARFLNNESNSSQSRPMVHVNDIATFWSVQQH